VPFCHFFAQNCLFWPLDFRWSESCSFKWTESIVEWTNLIISFNRLKRSTFHSVFRQVERTSFILTPRDGASDSEDNRHEIRKRLPTRWPACGMHIFNFHSVGECYKQNRCTWSLVHRWKLQQFGCSYLAYLEPAEAQAYSEVLQNTLGHSCSVLRKDSHL
jgi:hypothetical protein